MINITDDYNDFNNCTNIDNDDDNIIGKFLLSSIPGSIFLLSLIGLIIYTMIKPLKTNK